MEVNRTIVKQQAHSGNSTVVLSQFKSSKMDEAASSSGSYPLRSSTKAGENKGVDKEEWLIMKELMLCHLEFIEQQDKSIKELTKENELAHSGNSTVVLSQFKSSKMDEAASSSGSYPLRSSTKAGENKGVDKEEWLIMKELMLCHLEFIEQQDKSIKELTKENELCAEHVSPEKFLQMRMSTAVVNGNEADNHGHKQNHSDVVSSQFESTKMKNAPTSGPDFDKGVSSRVNENEGINQEELSSMKDLMLIHLDLIQQQAEQLSKKDKNIEDLTNENELLKQRLTRMERRVSLQKSKGDKKQQAHSSQDNPEAGRKRRHTEAPPPPQTLRPGRKSLPETSSSSSKRLRRDKTEGRKSRHRKADENENEPAINLDDKLTTNVAYYTAVGDDQRWAPDHFKLPRNRVLLEVPKWREQRYTPTYTLEGTENLSDDVFERRHYKLMIDEKKRKRWDIQRIREQRAAEKLRSREGNGDKNNEKAKFKTLWPEPSEGLRLAVTSVVPVSVFGINLPATTTQDFSLPWREGTKNRKKSKR